MAKLLGKTNPIEILVDNCISPMDFTAIQLVPNIDVSHSNIGEIISGARPISSDTALHLGFFISLEQSFGMKTLSEYYLHKIKHGRQTKIAPRILINQMVAR